MLIGKLKAMWHMENPHLLCGLIILEVIQAKAHPHSVCQDDTQCNITLLARHMQFVLNLSDSDIKLCLNANHSSIC